MARAITWAIRLTYTDGRSVFLRKGLVVGGGPIDTFYSKARAEEQAAFIQKELGAVGVVTVIERSHGRQAATR